MQYRPSIWLFLVSIISLVGICLPAQAHDTGLSGIRILYRRHDVVINVTTPLSKLAQGEPGGKSVLSPLEIDQAIRRRLRLRIDGRNWLPHTANIIGDNSNDIVSWQTILKEPARDIEVLSRLFPELANSRTVLSIVRDGLEGVNILLDADHPDYLMSQPTVSRSEVIFRYITEGVCHILSGLDHILFIIGILLLGGTWKSLLRTITTFTLAHSITLSLAATGILAPSPRLVEPLIALSIVAIAIENYRLHVKRSVSVYSERSSLDARPVYAFAFGLIHGFGFAGALAEVGLPVSALPLALASFNIGVELGQSAIVLTLFPLLAHFSFKQWKMFHRTAVAGSITIGLIGAFWFVLRLLPT
jgi:hypothetical protein